MYSVYTRMPNSHHSGWKGIKQKAAYLIYLSASDYKNPVPTVFFWPKSRSALSLIKASAVFCFHYHIIISILSIPPWCHPTSRRVHAALLRTHLGALAVDGPAGAPAGTAWAGPRLSSVRSVSLGSDARCCPGKVAPAPRMGKAGETAAVGWWRTMTLCWPGRTPCHSEGPDTGGWSRWKQGAPWTWTLTRCCR